MEHQPQTYHYPAGEWQNYYLPETKAQAVAAGQRYYQEYHKPVIPGLREQVEKLVKEAGG